MTENDVRVLLTAFLELHFQSMRQTRELMLAAVRQEFYESKDLVEAQLSKLYDQLEIDLRAMKDRAFEQASEHPDRVSAAQDQLLATFASLEAEFRKRSFDIFYSGFAADVRAKQLSDTSTKQ